MKNYKFIWSSICFLLLGLIISFVLRPYLPEYIPNTPFNVNGIILFALLLTTIITISRKIYREQENSNYIQIIIPPVFVVVVSELIFQIFRQLTLDSDSFEIRFLTMIKAVLLIGLFSLFISFFSAFQLKTKKTGYLIVLIIVVIILISFLSKILI